MQTLRSRLALVLLLCFARVLVPEAWILELHPHQHTLEEPAPARGGRPKALLSAQHQHCAVDHFCDVPFQVAPPLRLPVPFAVYQAPATAPQASVWQAATHATADLRGPPARS